MASDRSSSAADYESRARKARDHLRPDPARRAETSAHYEAHGRAGGVASGERPAKPPPQDNAQLAAALDLSTEAAELGGGASAAAGACAARRGPRVEPHRAGDREALRRPRGVQGVPADALDGPAARVPGEDAQCSSALAHYYQQQRASASKSKGLGEVALVEHYRRGHEADGQRAATPLPPPASACTTSSSSGRGGGDGARRGREKLELRGRSANGRGAAARERQLSPAPSAGGVMEMAAYWTRLGEMRGAYLPRAKRPRSFSEEGRSGAGDWRGKRRAVSAVDVRAPAHARKPRRRRRAREVLHGGARAAGRADEKLIAVSSGRAAGRQGAAGGAATPPRASRATPAAPAASGVVAESTSPPRAATTETGRRGERDEGEDLARSRERRAKTRRARTRGESRGSALRAPFGGRARPLRDAASASQAAPRRPSRRAFPRRRRPGPEAQRWPSTTSLRPRLRGPRETRWWR